MHEYVESVLFHIHVIVFIATAFINTAILFSTILGPGIVFDTSLCF